MAKPNEATPPATPAAAPVHPAVAAAAAAAVDDFHAPAGELDGLDFTALNADDAETPAAVAGEKEAPGTPEAAAEEPGDKTEPDAEPGEEPATEGEGEGEAEPVEAKAEKPAPVAAAPKVEPPAEPTAPDPMQAFHERQAKYLADRAAYRARVSAPGYELDPFKDGEEAQRLSFEAYDLMEQRQALVEQQLQAQARQQQEQAHYERFWGDFAKANPDVGLAKGQALAEQAIAEARTQYGHLPAAQRDVALQVAADQIFKAKVAQQKGMIRAKAAAATVNPPKNGAAAAPAGGAKPPVTPGGGRVAPAGATGRMPAAPVDEEHELVAAISGGIRGFRA